MALPARRLPPQHPRPSHQNQEEVPRDRFRRKRRLPTYHDTFPTQQRSGNPPPPPTKPFAPPPPPTPIALPLIQTHRTHTIYRTAEGDEWGKEKREKNLKSIDTKILPLTGYYRDMHVSDPGGHRREDARMPAQSLRLTLDTTTFVTCARVPSVVS